MNKKSFLKCGNCNKRLKLILVTYEQFCLAKRCPICYKMDFQNTSHVVAFTVVAQGNYTDYLGMMLIVHCALLKKIIMLINSQTIIETLKLIWKTINDILGRSKKQDVIKEIKLPEKCYFDRGISTCF